MPLKDWANGILGGTPLDADRLNYRDERLEAALLALARDPSQLFAGPITLNGDGAPTSAAVKWPDGVDGNYAGTPSTTFPRAIDAYTVTRVGPPFLTFTQPAVTRDPNGDITNRPAITITEE